MGKSLKDEEATIHEPVTSRFISLGKLLFITILFVAGNAAKSMSEMIKPAATYKFSLLCFICSTGTVYATANRPVISNTHETTLFRTSIKEKFVSATTVKDIFTN